MCTVGLSVGLSVCGPLWCSLRVFAHTYLGAGVGVLFKASLPAALVSFCRRSPVGVGALGTGVQGAEGEAYGQEMPLASNLASKDSL